MKLISAKEAREKEANWRKEKERKKHLKDKQERIKLLRLGVSDDRKHWLRKLEYETYEYMKYERRLLNNILYAFIVTYATIAVFVTMVPFEAVTPNAEQAPDLSEML